jgi:hypothetical protein
LDESENYKASTRLALLRCEIMVMSAEGET